MRIIQIAIRAGEIPFTGECAHLASLFIFDKAIKFMQISHSVTGSKQSALFGHAENCTSGSQESANLRSHLLETRSCEFDQLITNNKRPD
jgi:hypothetical protein